MNLVANAIKFTDHGEVAIAIDLAGGGVAGELHFTVSDTGIGIAADQRERIFTRYTQASPATAREYGGTRLGLAIVKQLIELTDGRIWVDSELGKGSAFHFVVRLGLQPWDRVAAARTAAPELAGKHVLVADPTAITRLALAEALDGCGAEITQVENGEQAIGELRRANEEGKPYRIVLSECRVRASDSIEPIRRVCGAAYGAEMVIPMLTSEELNLRLPLLRKIGLPHHLIKPVRGAELFVVIRALLDDAGAPQSARYATVANGTASSSGTAGAAELQAKAEAIIEKLAREVDITSIEPVEQIGDVRKLAQPSPIGRRLRILVADDSADNRLLIQAFLKQTACQVEQAENGAIALEKFVAGSYDVVLMDIQMPVMDGYTAARLIREWEQNHNASRTPIIALTASVLDEAVHKSFDAGCDTHVSKPVRRPTLLAAICEVTAKA
jgi:CheY-like chemotaxis protein